jgi:hypothetical protein
VTGIAFAAIGLAGGLGDRPEYWHAAWLDLAHHPLLGSGAGSFAAAWLRYRTINQSVEDAHNLYLETLAELGPIGLALLVYALALPLRQLATSLQTAPIRASCGAYAAFLIHSAIDWDWEMPVVTVAALLCAATLLNAQRPRTRTETARRAKVGAITIAVAACLVLATLNAAALAGSNSLHQAVKNLQSRQWTTAARSARNAARWQPWSAEPYDLLGQAQLAQGQNNAAANDFRHALQLDNQRWQTWYELGRISNRQQQHIALKHILQLNPFAVLEQGNT